MNEFLLHKLVLDIEDLQFNLKYDFKKEEEYFKIFNFFI